MGRERGQGTGMWFGRLRTGSFDKLRAGPFGRLRTGSQRTLRTGDDGYNGGSIKGAAPVRAAGMNEIRSANSPSRRRGAHVQHPVRSRPRSGFRGNR